MKVRYVALLVCALLICSAAAIACKNGGGGGNPRSTASKPTPGVTPLGTASAALQEYFQKVQALDATSSQRLTLIESTIGTPASEQDAIRLLADVIAEQSAILRDLGDGLKALDVPPEAKEAHDNAVKALDDFIAFSDKAKTQAATATALVDIAALINSKEAQDVNQALYDTCVGLVNAAASYGITVALNCGQG